MMNKYEEALNDIRYTAHHLNNHIYNCDEICDEYCDDLLTDCDILQELVDQQKTSALEEVIKEWEELGYTVKECENNNIKFYFTDCDKLAFGLDLETEEFIFVNKRIFELDEIQLLTKTFKALGWEEEK